MVTHVHCDACGITLLSFEFDEPKPIDRGDCPRCGGDEFSFVDG